MVTLPHKPVVLTAARKPWPAWVRIGLTVLILNELRGAVVVALTSPAWIALITSMFHAAMRR